MGGNEGRGGSQTFSSMPSAIEAISLPGGYPGATKKETREQGHSGNKHPGANARELKSSQGRRTEKGKAGQGVEGCHRQSCLSPMPITRAAVWAPNPQ